jgi:LemA protein
MKKPLLIIGAIVLVLGMWVMGTYNKLVSTDQVVDSQWAQVETQYQRRYDLIPNLVEATKGILNQEQEVFSNIAEARQGYAGANTTDEKVNAANQLDSALSRLLVIVENYPELKSNQNVSDLMVELAGAENRVSVERKRYNDTVRGYNILVKTFPTMIAAKVFDYSEKPYFEAVEAAEVAPKVDLKLSE